MDTLKPIIASNLSALRIAHHLTQLELAEKLNYSDKAVSKWERGESIPDVLVLKQLADLYGVTVDYLLQPHEAAEPAPMPRDEGISRRNRKLIVAISVVGVFCIATLSFVISGILGTVLWESFLGGLVVSLVVLLVFNSVWGQRKYRFWILTALLWSLLLCLFLFLPVKRSWLLLLLGIPAQIVVWLACGLRRTRGKSSQPGEDAV